jgi:predicted nucleic acid-binding protein
MGKKRKIFLDTNAVIYFLEGIESFEVIGNFKKFYYSFITEIELLAFSDEESRQIIMDFLKKGTRIKINNKIISQIIEIRKTKGLKVPDAIIVASTKIIRADLYTSDEELLRKVDFLNVINLLKETV